MSHKTNLENAREEADNARAELNKLRAAAEMVGEELEATLTKVREERQGEMDSLKAAASQGAAAMAKVPEGTTADVTKVRSKHDSLAAHHDKVLASTRCIVEAPEKRIDKAADTLSKLRQVYEEGRKV